MSEPRIVYLAHVTPGDGPDLTVQIEAYTVQQWPMLGDNAYRFVGGVPNGLASWFDAEEDMDLFGLAWERHKALTLCLARHKASLVYARDLLCVREAEVAAIERAIEHEEKTTKPAP